MRAVSFETLLPNYAGQINGRAGLKGFSIGGAKISEMHGNFIVNAGNANAKDVLDLIQYVKENNLQFIWSKNGNRSRNNWPKLNKNYRNLE